jgi:hypothetical protein
MYNYFTNECLSISLERNKDNSLSLEVSSDFGNSNYRKQQLHVCEKRLATAVEDLWKAVKSKKLQSVHVGFGEIDYYDNMTDIYHTPTAYIKRGKRKAENGWREHGSIPKDWSINLHARILDTTTIGPVMQVIQNAIGFSKFKPIEKQLTKTMRPVLQKKKAYGSYYNENTED